MRYKQKNFLKYYSMFLAFLIVGAAVFLTASCSEKSTKAADVQAAKSLEDNPLLKSFDTPYRVPPFHKIKPEHFLPAYRVAMKLRSDSIHAIAHSKEPPTFQNVVEPLDRTAALVASIERIFRIIHQTSNNEQLEAIAQVMYPLITQNLDDVFMNRDLFLRIKAVYEQKDKIKLSKEEAMLLYKTYTTMIRGGANLSPENMLKLRKVNEEIKLLFLKFDKNLQAEESKFKLVIDNRDDLEGLPQWVIQSAAHAAAKRGLNGKWVFTVDKSSMIPFLKFSPKRELREKIFKAFSTRGDHGDELDNKKIVSRIVALRIEKANLLGYKSFADYEMEDRMVRTAEEVDQMLLKFWKPALVTAKKEAAMLRGLIRKEGGTFKLQPWDWWYYAEKLRRDKYHLDEDTIRPYFKFENVRDGAFYVANKLYGVTFTQRTDLPKYHPDVQVFEVKDADGKTLGILYADYFARSGKRSGAWKDEFRRHEITDDNTVVIPIMSTNCNFPGPTADSPSLLSLFEARTLFHELGHALHGLFSECKYFILSGTAVKVDFVEFPAKLMENWVMAPEVLSVYARHYKTGEPIPQKLLDKIKKASRFNQGFETVEFLAACFLDMKWHSLEKLEDPSNFDVNKFENRAMDELGLIPEILPRYRSTYFHHLFRMTGYSVGYYSYLWADILDADAFTMFREAGLFDREVAASLRKHILSAGETADSMVLYKRFRGSEPKVEPLLKRWGLI